MFGFFLLFTVGLETNENKSARLALLCKENNRWWSFGLGEELSSPLRKPPPPPPPPPPTCTWRDINRWETPTYRSPIVIILSFTCLVERRGWARWLLGERSPFIIQMAVKVSSFIYCAVRRHWIASNTNSYKGPVVYLCSAVMWSGSGGASREGDQHY